MIFHSLMFEIVNKTLNWIITERREMVRVENAPFSTFHTLLFPSNDEQQ